MALADHVRVSRRFQRAIRIDSDFNSLDALEGFICPESSAAVLRGVANHITRTGQGAFTWTGPYGSGKSSLVIVMSALLGGDKKKREMAAKIVGEDAASLLWQAIPQSTNGLQVLPIVGRRDDPVKVIGEAIESFRIASPPKKGNWTEKKIIDAIVSLSTDLNLKKTSSGVIVFLDEMGKFLEAAAHDGFDLYVFQQLAEAAARSKGRLIIIGILHQAFEEYAHRLSREMRDEWAKIQGRFVDFAVNTAGEEQIDLLSRAIEANRFAEAPSESAEKVAECVRKQRPGVSIQLSKTLEDCWPLHPIVAALLGPISQKRFGQNQRSLFGFLNSAEPQGFQEFLLYAQEDENYKPDRLWDYLRLNLEPSILASPDGHRWAMATETVDRCEALGNTGLHLSLLKTIALIDIFRERSGLLPTRRLLGTGVEAYGDRDIDKALQDLKQWSFIIFRKHLNAYAVFAGSDFDIEDAIATTIGDIGTVDFQELKALANLQPILAKRHYHKTGSLRWFDVDITSVSQVVNDTEQYNGGRGTIGKFLLAIPTSSENEATAQKKCREASRKSETGNVIVGLSPRAWIITDLSRELLALERVRNERTELKGDAVARREVRARMASLQSQLENELLYSFDNATWYLKYKQPKQFSRTELNILASELSGHKFHKTPKIYNELLNRAKPSKSAVAAQNNLLRRMVNMSGTERLGIEGYPAEGGLFDSLLFSSGLYKETDQGWRFVEPNTSDPCSLRPLWEAAISFLSQNSDRSVPIDEIYDLWKKPPFGVKNGLLPVLAVAFFLSKREALAFYREGVFQAAPNDLDVDYLSKDPESIQLRFINFSNMAQRLLSDLSHIVSEIDNINKLAEFEPIEVARRLVSIYDRLPAWTKRTMRLSSNANQIRNLFKRANDPNKFLFDDLPGLYGEEFDLYSEEDVQKVVDRVREGLNELIDVYPKELRKFKGTLLAELKVQNDSDNAIADLRKRAENIKQLAGDFRLDAFISRLTVFKGSSQDIEGIVSLATNKPPREWVDTDLDRAAIEISGMAQKFIRIEAFAHVKGRNNKRHSMAVVIGARGALAPILHEFDVSDGDYSFVEDLANNIEKELQGHNIDNENIVLAALSELIARYTYNKHRDVNSQNSERDAE